MKQKSAPTSSKLRQEPNPQILRLSLRQMLLWLGTAGATVVAGFGSATVLRGEESPQSPDSSTRFQLPRNPSHNPAFFTRAIPNQEALVWTHGKGKEMVAYRLNIQGRDIWRLCDGSRTPAQIAAEYEAKTGRPQQEATGFLEQLQNTGVVVTGGFVVSAGRFPRPPAGGCYHAHLLASDPKTS